MGIRKANEPSNSCSYWSARRFYEKEEGGEDYRVLIYTVDPYVEMTRHKTWYGDIKYKNIYHPGYMKVVMIDSRGNSIDKEIGYNSTEDVFKQCINELSKSR